MDPGWNKDMDSELEIGVWLMKEARVSYRYWHSSASLRTSFAKPFFDRTQCEHILKQYQGPKPRIAA